MLNNQTATTLTDLGLKGMAEAFREQRESVQYLELSFEERFAMLVEREAMDRDARRLVTRLRAAKLRHQALGDPTLSDAVLDRLFCNSHIIAMSGTSMRTKKS